MSSIAVAQAFDAFMLGAMDTAENGVAVLHAMADDTAATVRADWRQRLDRAFERVEDHGAAVHPDLETLVVIVAALRALPHECVLLKALPR
jgi:hypothetical protein